MNRKQLLTLLRATVLLGALFAAVFSLGCASAESETGATLPGTSWLLKSYADGKGDVASVLEDTHVRITFSTKYLAGSAGCNSYWGTYATTDGDTLSISSLDSTKLSCAEPAGIMEQEVAYLSALRHAATFNIRGDGLELRAADGALVASYEAWKAPPGGLFHGGSRQPTSP